MLLVACKSRASALPSMDVRWDYIPLPIGLESRRPTFPQNVYRPQMLGSRFNFPFADLQNPGPTSSGLQFGLRNPADEVHGVVDAAAAFILCNLRVWAQRTRAIHFSIRGM